MSIGDLTRAIRLRWRLELLIAVVVSTAALAAALAIHRSVVATATVMIDQRPVEADTEGRAAQPIDMDRLVGTQADLAKSARVLDLATRLPVLTENQTLRAEWTRTTGRHMTFAAWAVQALRAQLAVDHDRGSNILQFRVTGSDPAAAAILANAAAQAYVTIQRQLATDPARTYADWYRSRISESRRNLELAQASLVAFQRDHKLVASQSLDADAQQLQELTGQLALAEGARAEANARAASDGSAIAGAQGNKALGDLRTAEALQVAKNAELSERLGPRHPEMIAAQATLAELRQQIRALQGDVAHSQRIESSGADQRAAALRRLVTMQRGRILSLQGDRAQLDQLQRDVQSASASYDAIHARLMAMRLQADAPRSNVRQLDIATAPSSGGNTLLAMSLVLSVLLGVGVAITVAIVREWMDPRVRTHATLATVAGAPVLTIMPPRWEMPLLADLGRSR